MNILGIDFGHGEISASYQRSDTGNVKQLKLVKTTANNAEQWKIPSYLYKYQDSDGNFAYSLDKPLAPHMLLSELKKPISYMDETDKEHYRAFIQLVYQRLLDCNSELNDNDFVLAIACPTKWLDYQKDEYKEFFEEALEDYDVHIYAIMNESDAAFFAKYKKEDQHKNVLVVDYGSSTIDFTLVSHGKKVMLDEMSSANLGASAIENAVLTLYSQDNQSNYRATHQFVDSFLQQNRLEWIDLDRFMLAQIREKKEQSFTKGYPYIEQCRVSPFQVTGFEGLRGKQNVFEYELETPLMEVKQLQEYVTNVEEVFTKLKERTNNEGGIDKIIMSGGACMMAWVKDAIMEVFEIPDNKIELDRNPAFVVCDGIVKYCQELQKCVEKVIRKVNDIDFQKMIQDSDNDTINAIALLDVKSVMQNWRNNGSSIQDLLTDICLKCYATYNSGDSRFSALFKEKMSSKITSEVQSQVEEIIKSAFGIDNISADGFTYNYNYPPYYAYSKDTLKALFLYLFKYIEDTHRNWDWSFDHWYDINGIDYDKYRSYSEREEVFNTLTDSWRFDNLFKDIDRKALKGGYAKLDTAIIEDIKNEVLQYSLCLIDQKKLFQTSFSK